jgi:glycine oxidase
MQDCLVIGGGVIGLSIAYELAGRGRRVRVVDAGQPGREASWAGAGILPPAGSGTVEPLEQLAALSNRLHAAWSEELRATTGIDNGYRRSGAIYLARDAIEARVLEQMVIWAGQRGVVAERLSADALEELEPGLRPNPVPESAYLLPDECQIRNPRHLKALLVGCANRGVEITAGAAVEDFDIRADRVVGVRTSVGSVSAEQVCVTAGAWSGAVAGKLGFTASIRPIRGQILLLATARPVVSRIVNVGGCYLVPRPDGRLLVGSTEEDVGFDRGTTARAAGDLLAFALNLVPALETAQLERSWAGLRPATGDGLPYLGHVPGLQNAFLAAGHFRSGLQLSTGTARVMSQLITGGQVEIDLGPFRLDREAVSSPPAEPGRSRGKVSLS